MLVKQNLLPISEFYKGAVRSDLKIPNEKHLDELCGRYGLNKEYFYLANGIHEPFVYWDKEFLIFSFVCFDEEYLMNIGIRRLPRKKELLSLGVVNFFKETPMIYQMFLLEQNLKSISDEELSEIMDNVIHSYALKNYEISSELSKRLKSSFIEKRKVKDLFKNNSGIDVFSGLNGNGLGSGKWCSTEMSTALLSSINVETNKVGDIYKSKVKNSDVLYFNPNNGTVITNSRLDFVKINMVGIDEKKPEISSIFNKYKSLLSLNQNNIQQATRAFSVAIVIALFAREHKVSREDRDFAMLYSLLTEGGYLTKDSEELSLPIEVSEALTEKQITALKDALSKEFTDNELVSKAKLVIEYALGEKKISSSDVQLLGEWFKYIKVGFCLNFED